MNIKELLEQLRYVVSEGSYKLYEFALPQSEIRQKCHNLSTQIVKHSIRILYYGTQETKQHWASELQNWFEDCFSTKIKKDNRYPTSQEVYKWLKEPYEKQNDMDRIIQNIEQKLGRIGKSYDDIQHEVFVFIQRITKYDNDITTDIIIKEVNNYIRSKNI